MSGEQEPMSIEARVARLEAHANRQSWLDEPAMINGEPVRMGNAPPIEGKIIIALFLIVLASIPCLLIYVGVSEWLSR